MSLRPPGSVGTRHPHREEPISDDRAHPTPIEELRAEFPILREKVYLNSCSLGALSTRAEEHLGEFLREWHAGGASAWYEHWLGRLDLLRERVAAFFGAGPREIALLPSVSAALSAVAESVDYRRRPKVVCAELDFPTLPYQWRVKPDVELEVVPSDDGVGIDPERWREAVDGRTTFLATSHVFFSTGYVQDLELLAEIAHDAGARLLVDGYQAAGQIPVDPAAAGADFYVAGPLKWLCGGPGLSYLWVRPELISRLRPTITSWFAARDQFDFDVTSFVYRDDARRFELGTPALPTVHLALGGQEVVDDAGIEAIHRRNRSLTDRLVDGARERGMEVAAAGERERRSAIVGIRHDDPAGAVKHLAERGIVVDHRPGRVRASPHFYNTREEVDAFLEALAAYPG